MSDNDIAIVGMAAHLPGARDTTAFWQNLRDGVESVRQLSEDELARGGRDPGGDASGPATCAPRAPLDDVFDFDADFFGLSPEGGGDHGPPAPPLPDGGVGGHGGRRSRARVVRRGHRRLRRRAAWAATSSSTCCSNPDLVRDVGLFLLRHTGNDKDFLATRASYLLDLRGPSVNVQTACSTSLVATHLAVSAPALRRVRHGPRRRRHHRDPPRAGLPVPRGRGALARRPLPGLRPPVRRAPCSAAAPAWSRCGGSTTPSPTATRSTPSSRARPSTTTAP